LGEAFCGMLLTGALLIQGSRYLLSYGFDLSTALPLGLACTLTGVLGARCASREVGTVRVPLFLVIAGLLLTHWSAEATSALLKLFPGAAAGNSLTGFLVLFCGACLMVGPVVGGASWLAQQGTVGSSRSNWLLLGACLGCFGWPLLLAAQGPESASWLIVAGLVFFGFTTYWLSEGEQLRISDAATADSALQSREVFSIWTLTLVAGLMLPAAMQLARQLAPASLWLQATLWGGLGCGLLIGQCTRSRQAVATGAFGCWILAAWGAGLLFCYPWWLKAHLQLTTYVSSLSWLWLGRCGLVAIMTLPAGYALSVAQSSRAGGRFSWLVLVAGLGIGWWLALATGLAPQLLLGVVVTMLLISAGLSWWCTARTPESAVWLQRWTGSQTRRVISGLQGVGILLVAVGLLIGWRGYAPERVEALLFSSTVFQGLRSGTALEKLPYLAEQRPLWSIESVSGRWSVWRSRGQQWEVRQNGLTLGVSTPRHIAGPLHPGDVLAAALPLALAETADHVLVIGCDGSAILETALEFPVRTITVWEGDTTALAVSNAVLSQTQSPCLTDDRIAVQVVNPLLAAASDSGNTFDVIVANSAQLLSPRNLPLTTQEFYGQIRGKLNPEGVFCQRFTYFDLGPEALGPILQSMLSVFPEVTVIEPVPGELLAVASTGEPLTLTEANLSRFSAEHSRRAFARMGWDWSLATQLPGVSHGKLTELCAAQTEFSARHNRLAWQLPWEVARWDAKALQSREWLISQAAPLGATLRDEDTLLDLNHRLQDYQQRLKIAAEHPDESFAYRAALKKRLLDRPRTEIVPVRYEGVKRTLHQEDANRKQYLEALGALAQQATPAAAAIEQLAAFGTSYDPLLTDFARYEAAHLYARCTDGHPRDAFSHWRHCVYFAPPHDRSVRTVCAAIQMLNQFPSSTESAADRWDELQGLLEELERRWWLRRQSEQRLKYESVDVQHSLDAAIKALRTLDELAPQVPVDPEAWKLRREMIQEQLVRPLRSERSLQFATGPSPALVPASD
jgi:hypothetical protein